MPEDTTERRRESVRRYEVRHGGGVQAGKDKEPMSLLQYIRWRLGTYRAAYGTVMHILSREPLVTPRTLVDAVARNSEFMRVVAKWFPSALVYSFEPCIEYKPIGIVRRVRLGIEPWHRLAEWTFDGPSLLKVDCNGDTIRVIQGTDLTKFEWVVVEVSEDGNGSPNNRSQINDIMRDSGLDRSKCVDAVVCIRTHRISQTDVLFWRSHT